MEERNNRRTFVGTVKSASNDKTISVLVKTDKKHPLYSKRVSSTKVFRAHDELNVAEEGDLVEIMECRPLSRTKRFRLVQVLEKKVK